MLRLCRSTAQATEAKPSRARNSRRTLNTKSFEGSDARWPIERGQQLEWHKQCHTEYTLLTQGIVQKLKPQSCRQWIEMMMAVRARVVHIGKLGTVRFGVVRHRNDRALIGREVFGKTGSFARCPIGQQRDQEYREIPDCAFQ